MKCQVCPSLKAKPKYYIIDPPIILEDTLCDKCANFVDSQYKDNPSPYFDTAEEAELHAMVKTISGANNA